MCKRLTHDEWLLQPLPVYWIKTDFLKNRPTIFIDFIEKWCRENLSGAWWYREVDVFCFSCLEDRATLKLYILTNAFDQEYGELTESTK
jgi:hypothetical protein